MDNNVAFFLKYLEILIKKSFNELSRNIKIIITDVRSIVGFLTILPFVYYTLKIQVFVGLVFVSWYSISFLIFHIFLKTIYNIDCKEIPLNTSHLTKYVLFNVFIFVPRAKAYILFYKILYFYANRKKNKPLLLDYLFFISGFLIIYFIKFTFVLMLGYTYLSLLVTSELIVKLKIVLSWNYEDNVAKYQHILINCFIDNAFSVGAADEMNIEFEGDLIHFNMKKFFINFFANVKNPELLTEAYNIKEGVFTQKLVNKHFTYTINSTKYSDKNITKNFTSSKFINVKDENGVVEQIECKDTYNPNLKGEFKDNSLTPGYELYAKSAVIGRLDKQFFTKMNVNSKNVLGSILYEKDNQIVYNKNKEFFKKNNAPTIRDHCKEYKISVYENIEKISEFERRNEDYLKTKEGSQEYEVFKTYMKRLHTNLNDNEE